jgi:hypothetical protein
MQKLIRETEFSIGILKSGIKIIQAQSQFQAEGLDHLTKYLVDDNNQSIQFIFHWIIRVS